MQIDGVGVNAGETGSEPGMYLLEGPTQIGGSVVPRSADTFGPHQVVDMLNESFGLMVHAYDDNVSYAYRRHEHDQSVDEPTPYRSAQPGAALVHDHARNTPQPAIVVFAQDGTLWHNPDLDARLGGGRTSEGFDRWSDSSKGLTRGGWRRPRRGGSAAFSSAPR